MNGLMSELRNFIGSVPGAMRACVPLTPLGQGRLFFLVDPDAQVGCTVANRPMTEDEHAQYLASGACSRRRKPGSTIDDDEERAQRKRTADLMREIDEQHGVIHTSTRIQ